MTTQSAPQWPLAATAALFALILAGCGATQTVTVGPVELDVPRGWDRSTSADPGQDLIAEERWRPSGDGRGTLQVIVGCGDADADQLRQAMSETYSLAGEADGEAVEVVGLRSAQRIDWELRAAPTGETGAFRMAGLYGAGSGGLIVVELGRPADAFDAELADRVLASVEVDADDLAERCSTD